jgi:hypothetical protein
MKRTTLSSESSIRPLPDELLERTLRLFPRWWFAECCSAVCRRWRRTGERICTSGDYAPLLIIVSSSANVIHILTMSGDVVNSFEARPQNLRSSLWRSSTEPCWPTCAAAAGDRLFVSQYRMQGILEYKLTGQNEASGETRGGRRRFTPFPPASGAGAVDNGVSKQRPPGESFKCQYVRSLVTNPASALCCPEGVVLGKGTHLYVCNALGEWHQ